MTREEAWDLVRSPTREIDYNLLDGIFRAFGFVSETKDFATELYYHRRFPACGAFPARDDGIHVLTAEQRALVQGMLECVVFSERWATQERPR